MSVGKGLLVLLLFKAFITVCKTTNIDLAFIVDSSGSIRDTNPEDGSYDNWEDLLKFVVGIIDNIPGNDLQVGVVIFSDSADVLVSLNEDIEDAKQAILNAEHLGQDTNTAAALYTAQWKLFNTAYGDRSNASNWAIIITDGTSNDHDMTIQAAKALHDDCVTIMAIGFTSLVNENEIKEMSSPPHLSGKNYYMSPDVTSLTNIIDSIVKNVAVDTTSLC